MTKSPDRDTCAAMRHGGFRWAPSVGAWQRQLNSNAIWTAKHMDCLHPLPAEQAVSEPVTEPPKDTGSGWGFYIVADLKTWTDNAENRSPLEHFLSFEAAQARFEELRDQDYNSESVEPGPDGQPPARLALGLESADGMSAADILHVRRGENYLVTDFTGMDRFRDDPAVMDILSRISREIGFDFVRVYEQDGSQIRLLPKVLFAEWDNPYFSSAAPGSIAAKYYDFLHECYPLPKDGDLRAGQIDEVVQYLQREGKNGADQLTLAIAGLAAGLPDNPAVQRLAAVLTAELAQFNEPGQAGVRRQKQHRKRSQER